ncbi:MAG: hypothetical protein ABI402_14275 [Ferruginibacter sp.]
MSETIWVAIISAFTTIVTAVITLYPEIIKSKKEDQEELPDGEIQNIATKRVKKTVIRLIIVSVSILILVIIGDILYTMYDHPISTSEFEKIAEKKATNPYIVQSATAIVNYDDSLYIGKTQRHTYVRIVYVLKLLKDISKKDEKAFEEEYYSSETKPSPEHWYGTEKEIFINDNGSKYSLSVEGKKGDVLTVVTGATYSYPIPLADKRITPKGSITLTGSNDYYAYLNELDYIENLTIVLESPQIIILPYGDRSAFSVRDGKEPEFEEAFIGQSNSPNRETAIRQKSVSMHWKNVEPGTYNGIIYQWK